MRTPGRCTNFETCWLANGRRDIRVMIGDPFVCPACGERLRAPSIESISASGIAGAIVVSIGLVAAAGGAGFGAVRLAETTDLTKVAALASGLLPHQSQAPVRNVSLVRKPHGARAPVMAQAADPRSGQAAPPHAAVVAPARVAAQAPQPDTSLLAKAALLAPAPQFASLAPIPPAAFAPDPLAPAVTLATAPRPQGNQQAAGKVIVIGAEPARPLVLPISFGRPHAPEDDTPARSAKWHHHAIGLEHRNGFLPAPSWSADDSAAMQQVQQAVPPAQGDSDYDSAVIEATTAAAETASYSAPAQQADTDAPAQDQGQAGGGIAYGGGLVPAQQANTAVPASAAMGGASFDSAGNSPQITRLIVPATMRAARVPQYQEAARIDPAMAAQVDHVPDAETRLATLPPAPAEKLAVPEYPPQAEDIARPGRVDVGCVITPRGVPSGCQVHRQEGGLSFAHAVLAWLKSGSVRYRPSVIAGHPAAEPREYKVRFEP